MWPICCWQGPRFASASLLRARFRSVLVVTEIALALVLVIGSTLLVRTYLKLQAVDPGFDRHNTLTMAMSVSGNRFQTSAPVAQMIRQGTERIKTIPGVTEAS